MDNYGYGMGDRRPRSHGDKPGDLGIIEPGGYDRAELVLIRMLKRASPEERKEIAGIIYDLLHESGYI